MAQFTDAQKTALREHLSAEEIDAAELGSTRAEALEELAAWTERYAELREDESMDQVFAIVDAAVKSTLEPEASSDEEREKAGAPPRREV